MKTWLKRINEKLKSVKTIFETLVAASLTVMGVLVSIAAVVVSVNANKIMSKQYELERYGAEPVFTVKWEDDSKHRYVIKNTGAKIYDVVCSSVTFIDCYYYPTEEDARLGHARTCAVEFGWVGHEFNEQAQFFSLDVQNWREKTTSVKDDINKVEKTVVIDYCIYIVFEYKNYRNDLCSSVIEIKMSLYDADSEFDYSFFVDAETSSYIEKIDSVDFIVYVGEYENPFEAVQERLTEYLESNR